MDPQQLASPTAASPQLAAPTQGVFPARSTAGMPAIGNVAPLARPWHAIFAVTAVFIAIVALFIAYFLDVRYTAQAKRDAAQANSIQTALTDPTLQQTEKQANQYAAALTGYQSAVATQQDYSRVLSEIDQRLSKEAVLDSINIDERGTVRMSGRVPSFELAAKTFESYKNATLLKNVALSDVSLSQSNGQQVSFTITAVVQFASTEKVAAPGGSEGL